MHKVAGYKRVTDGTGYIIVLVVLEPYREKLALHLFDLRELPGFERPKRQHGWLMYDRSPVLPDPNSFCRYVLPIDCDAFSGGLTQADLFPLPSQDPGYAALLDAPYVQIPSLMVRDCLSDSGGIHSSSEESEDMSETCSAIRLIDVPEYGSIEESPVDPQWDDVTIFEPHPMRLWYRWDFEIGRIHSGISGNINRTSKITITPTALALLRQEAHSTNPRWLDLGTDGNFFTFAALDHDKVIDHGPPYHGVWLQRQEDLVVEIPMSADDHVLSVHAGHVYLTWNERLLRQQVANSCTCQSPEAHDERLIQLMAIPDLVDQRLLRVVPHPFHFSSWYFVW